MPSEVVPNILTSDAYSDAFFHIPVAEPLSIYVDTYGTGKKTDEEIVTIIRKNWDLRPGVIGMLHRGRPGDL